MTKIGDVLQSTDADRPDLRVLAGERGRWIVEGADEFGAPHVLEDDEAAAYGVVTAPAKADEAKGWRKFGEAATAGRRILPERKSTPEEALRDGTARPVNGSGSGAAFDGSPRSR